MKLLRTAGIAACAVACAAFAAPNPVSIPVYDPGKAAVLRPTPGKPIRSVYDNAYRNMFEYVIVGTGWTDWKDGDKDAQACLAMVVEHGHAREIRTMVELPKGLDDSARETLLANLIKAGVVGVCASSAEDENAAARHGLFFMPGGMPASPFLAFKAAGPNGRAREIARCIQGCGKITVLADDPYTYFASIAADFIRRLPVAFDETKCEGVAACKDASCDNVRACIRRIGSIWYVAVANAGPATSVTLDLSSISSGRKRITAFADVEGKEGMRRIDSYLAKDERRIKVDLIANGGYVARIEPPTLLFLAGDSTLSPRRFWRVNGSWGDALRPYLSPEVWMINRAVGGRSTRSYRPHWDHDIMPNLREGDWVLIEFGPNDAVKKDPNRYSDVPQYKENLRRYIAEVRSKGGNPLLVSSIASRRYKAKGEWNPKADLQSYADGMAAVALELDVPFIPMLEPTGKVVETAGSEDSKRLFVYFSNGKDNVHPSKDGAKAFAKVFLDELKKRPGHRAAALFNLEALK